MTINVYLSAIVCVLGAIIFAITDGAKHAEAKEMGHIMFSWGLLVFLLCFCHSVVVGSIR